MTILNNAELITAIKDFAVRTDFSDATVSNFIALAEGIFNYGDGKPGTEDYIAPLRTRDMHASVTVTITDDIGLMPTDIIQLETVYRAADSHPLEYVTQFWYYENFPTGQGAESNFYTVSGDYVVSGADVTIDYFTKIADLATSSQNWLILKAANAYLHGGLFFLNVYEKNGDAAAVHRSLMANAIAGLQGADMSSVITIPQRRASMVAW